MPMPPRPSSSSSTKRSLTMLPAPRGGPSATDLPRSVQLEFVGREPVGEPVPVGERESVTPRATVKPSVLVGVDGALPPLFAAGVAARGGLNCVFSPSGADGDTASGWVVEVRGARNWVLSLAPGCVGGV